MDMKLTEKETKLLKAIMNSEYRSGDPTKYRDAGLEPVWVDCIWGFEGKRAYGGVMASLCKKGLVETDGETVTLTEAGLDAALASN